MGKRLSNQNRSRRTRRGFTLLELVVALVVLGILAALAVPTYAAVIGNAHTGVANSTALSVATDAVAIGAQEQSPATVASLTTAVSETPGVSFAPGGTPVDTAGTLTATLAITTAGTTIDTCVQIPDKVNGPPTLCGGSGGGSTTTTAPTTTTTVGASATVTDFNNPLFDYAQGIAVAGSKVYVDSYQGSGGYGTAGSVEELNPATGSVTQLNTPGVVSPNGISTDGTDVWVADSGASQIFKIDVGSGDVTTIPTPSSYGSPNAISSDGTDVFVTTGSCDCSGPQGEVEEYNIASGVWTQIASTSFVGLQDVYSDGTDAWTVNAFGGGSGGAPGPGSVSKIDIATGAVTVITDASINSPGYLYSNGHTVYLANDGGGPNGTGSISAINIATGAVTEIDNTAFAYPNAISSGDGGTNLWVNNTGGGPNGTGDLLDYNTATSSWTSIDNSNFYYPGSPVVDGSEIWNINYGSSSPYYNYVTETTP